MLLTQNFVMFISQNLFNHSYTLLIFGVNVLRAHACFACEGGRSGHLTWHYSFFFLFLSSFHVLPNLRTGIKRRDTALRLALAGGVRALWVSEHA